MKTFEEWFNDSLCAAIMDYGESAFRYSDLNDTWNFATAQMQAKLDEQGKELEALRGFIKDLIINIDKHSKQYGLIDENGPTPLLMGDK